MITNQLLYRLSYVGLGTYAATNRHKPPLSPRGRHDGPTSRTASSRVGGERKSPLVPLHASLPLEDVERLVRG